MSNPEQFTSGGVYERPEVTPEAVSDVPHLEATRELEQGGATTGLAKLMNYRKSYPWLHAMISNVDKPRTETKPGPELEI